MTANLAGYGPRLLIALALMIVVGCGNDPAPEPTEEPGREVPATVASFSVVASPAGSGTVERIAVSEDGKVRLPDEKVWWRLFDIESREVITVDEIARTVKRDGFEQILERLHARADQRSDAPVIEIGPVDDRESVAGYQARAFRIVMGRGYERVLWVSDRTLIHSELFLLRLATDPIPPEDLPSLRPLVDLMDQLDGYPVIDRSRMEIDDVTYEIERRLITVAPQKVPASWFELPEWAEVELKALRAGRQPAASPLAGQNARGEESRPSD